MSVDRRPSPSSDATAERPRYRLAALVAAVLIAHGVLLSSLPHADAATPSATPVATPSTEITKVLPLTTRAVPQPTPTATASHLPSVPEPDALLAKPHHSTDNAPSPRATSVQAEHTQLHSTPAIATDNAEVLVAAADIRPAETPPTPPKEPAAQRLSVIPEPVRLKYDIKGEARGFPYSVDGEMLWQHDGTNYEARLSISHFLLGTRMQTSKGVIGPYGLEPVRFGDKVRSEVAAHFDRSKARVTFSANTPDVALQTGAQDQLSVFMQLAALFGSAPNRYPAGSAIPFQAIGPRSSEDWVFKVEGPEKLTLAGAEVATIKLSRAAIGEFDARGEVWLAPSMGYMPARIRITQSNGDFIDQRWSASQKP